MGAVTLSDAMVETLRARVRPFEEAELALVRAVLQLPRWLDEPAEAALRHALNLARLGQVRAPSGEELELWDFLAPFRAEVASALIPALLRDDSEGREEAARLAPPLGAAAWTWRGKLLHSFDGRLPAETLDRELREKALVLVCGGGGGVSWSYVGAFDLLERHGLVPRLCAGASMGALMLLFRARTLRWDGSVVPELVAQLGYKKLFRFLQTDSRYALPAAIQLQLREVLGEHVVAPDGSAARLTDLAIPLIVAVTGVVTGSLPHDPGFYEHLLDGSERRVRPHALERLVARFFEVAGELALRRDLLVPIYLGADEETADFDALDAVGFSCALPGVVHYDMLRDDPRMRAHLDALFERHGIARLLDGGLTDNLPARAAWEWVQRGGLGTRNALVLGLEGFAPKLRQPLWYALEQLAAQTAVQSRPFVHVHRSFQRVLSPLDVIPGKAQLARAIQSATAELQPDLPLLARLCRPYRPQVDGS
jgi:predicted acylesterase/phospholipase RssA